MKCPLCPPIIDKKTHQQCWWAWIDGGHEKVVQTAAEAGISINKRESKAHFESHCPVQPGLRKIDPEQLNKKIDRTPMSRLKIVDLLWRVPGLDGKTINKALYWNGDPENLNAAEKNALRDLKKLFFNDFIYRVFLDNLPGSVLRPTVGRGLFFLNQRGRDLLEKRTSANNILDSEIHPSADKLGSWQKIHAELRAQSVLSGLFEELQSQANPEVGWNQQNWFSSRHLPRYLTEDNAKRIPAANALAALTLHRDQQIELLPFLFYHHNYRKLSKDTAEKALECLKMASQGVWADVFPNLPYNMIPTVVIVCQDDSGYKQIIQASKKLRGSREFVAIICREDYFSLDKPVFTRIYARSEKRISLLEALSETRKLQGSIPGTLIDWINQPQRKLKPGPKTST
jgi:hypothetical protein